MTILKDLANRRDLWARCPHCEDEFRLADAGLFDATGRLPERAVQKLEELKAGVVESRDDLARRKRAATEKPKIAAKAANIGKVVEKIAPSLVGFPASPEDCRTLFEPIDYVVFQGLRKGSVEALFFVDVKSGNAQLTARQKEIRRTVEDGKVSLEVHAVPGDEP